MSAATLTARPVLTAVKGLPTSDGAGVRMTRLLGTPQAQMFDPFLLLDHFNTESADDYVGGFPDHPHRGFETVTYMLDGRMRHKDNTGREGVIGPGGVQWMRAGKGVVHSEMPEQSQGRMRGFQLWVNLPASQKMSPPDYQEYEADQIPVETRPGGVSIKTIAGRTAGGATGPVGGGAVGALYFDVSLPAGATFEEPVPADHNVMLAVYEGAVRVGDQRVEAPGLVLLGQGDAVQAAAESDARFLLIAGRPLNEPVAWGGPFVMNSREEVMAAFEDFRAGRF
jgi:quercetin 2,3-dioxygenase